MKRIISLIILATALFGDHNALADSKFLKFDKEVHNFGQVLVSDGALSCSFSARNISPNPVSIQSVTTSCSCTNVQWDHKAIAPGATTVIKATYTNDEGPYPFDKTLTVKLVGEQRPILLHIRGISQEALKTDDQLYTFVFGQSLGMISDNFKCGSIEQGRSKSDSTPVANLSGSPIRISFIGVTEGLSIEVSPNPVPAKGHAQMKYTVTALPDKWGGNIYKATPCINGKTSGKSISVKAFTAENFSSLTKAERSKGSRPIFKESTFSFGHKKQGAKFTASFTCTNKGEAVLNVHRAESEYIGATPGAFPSIAPGESGKFCVDIDTKNLPKGEALVQITLTTNSPLRPIVNLFVAGWID